MRYRSKKRLKHVAESIASVLIDCEDCQCTLEGVCKCSCELVRENAEKPSSNNSETAGQSNS